MNLWPDVVLEDPLIVNEGGKEATWLMITLIEPSLKLSASMGFSWTPSVIFWTTLPNYHSRLLSTALTSMRWWTIKKARRSTGVGKTGSVTTCIGAPLQVFLAIIFWEQCLKLKHMSYLSNMVMFETIYSSMCHVSLPAMSQTKTPIRASAIQQIIDHHFQEPGHYPTVLQVHVSKDTWIEPNLILIWNKK